ncbi:unnamed protein product [Schistocephalus solidus]|uniref:Uncharacterized protein n=1 Tax=Schistocephalus solidus TaxID=70667 RepID=A0A183TB10_SCHSO|nr:unnamed protein product [Schistocephalus solidus]
MGAGTQESFGRQGKAKRRQSHAIPLLSAAVVETETESPPVNPSLSSFGAYMFARVHLGRIRRISAGRSHQCTQRMNLITPFGARALSLSPPINLKAAREYLL